MRSLTGGLLGRAKRRVADDLRSDPYLPYVLLLAAVLAGFWFWHRIPNFATRDERWRIVDPLAAFGVFAENPGWDSLMRAMQHGRTFGATFYIYGLVVLPVVVVVVLTGQVEALSALPRLASIDLWAHWNRTPRWIWTWSLALGRLATVALAVACVYVTYRIGTTMHDRAAGRLAAVLLSVTWGFLMLSHEVGEDVPALLFVLLVVYLGLQYARTGEESLFLAGCVCGAFAIAIKLTMAVTVPLLAVAYLLRVRNAGSEWRDALFRPRLLLAGAVLGAATIFVSFPTVLAGGLHPLGNRLMRGAGGKTNPHGWRIEPTWWWVLRGYLNGLGLPLFVGAIGGVLASIPQLRKRSPEADGIVLALIVLATYAFLYRNWAYVRTHHLLPTFPILVLLLAVALRRLYAHRRRVARPLIAALVLSTALYAGVGDLGYATQPRDEATEWLRTNAAPNATVETYPTDPQEAAVPHGMRVYRPTNRRASGGANESRGEWVISVTERCPEYIELNYYQAILFLAPDDWSERARRLSGPRRTEHFRRLLAGDVPPYEVAATFGPRPAFLDGEPRQSRLRELLEVGIYPRTIQYGDPQDVGIDQYTVILERTGPCSSGGENATALSRPPS